MTTGEFLLSYYSHFITFLLQTLHTKQHEAEQQKQNKTVYTHHCNPKFGIYNSHYSDPTF